MLLNYVASTTEWLFMGRKAPFLFHLLSPLFSLTFSSPSQLCSLLASFSTPPALYFHISDIFNRFFLIAPRESAHAANSEMNLIFPAQITKTIVEKYLSKNPLWQASTNTEKLSHGDMAIGFEHISKDNN